VLWASFEFARHQEAKRGSVCLAALNAFRSTGSDHDRHGVTSSAPTPYVSSAFLCHHDAVTHDTAQL
jgi:hypothetical protein